MASTSVPRILTFKADGVIPKGSAVKIGSDSKHVAKSTAASDKSIGIAQGASAAAEDYIEVALPGGGAKGLAGGTIAAGDMLVPDSNGALVASTTNGERHVAVAMESAVVNDIFATEAVVGII